MKALVIGGTKFIGRHVVRRLVEEGHEVVLFNRGRTDPNVDLPVVIGDVNRLREHTAELRRHAFDAVIHCIAYTPQHAADLVAVFGERSNGALSRPPMRALVLSSQDCYEAFQRLVRGTDTSAFPIREDAATSEREYYYRGSGHPWGEDYDKNLVTEEIMRADAAGQLRATVLRLPMVYGPYDEQFAHRHAPILHHVLAGEPVYVVGANRQATIWHFGYVENVAAAIVHALASEQAEGAIYNIGDEQVRTWRAWTDLYAHAAGVALELRVVPDQLVEDDAAADAAPQHWIADVSAFARDTGYVEQVGVEEAVARTLAYARAHPDVLGPAPDFALHRKRADALGATLESLVGT